MSNDLVALERAFDPLLDKFTQVLQVPGISLTAPRLVRSILISCERNPVLLSSNRQSLYNAAMSAACLGLECDGVTGQAFLIPFKARVQLVIGYKGYVTLGARSGLTITGEVVRQGDRFDFDEGEGWIKHKKQLGKPDRRIIATWAKAAALDRPPVVKVLDIADILAVKAKSPAGSKPDSPWMDAAIGFPAMAEKTAKRRLARSLPLNVMQTAARLDEAVEEQGRHAYITPERGVIVEAEEATPMPAEALIAQPAPELDLGLGSLLGSYRTALQIAAGHGTAALKQAWEEMPNTYRRQLQDELKALKKVAKTHD
jgi:recombination protein RecT